MGQLIQIGKVFRDTSQREPKIASIGRSTVHQVISKANSDFHEALDVVEIELVSRNLLICSMPLIGALKVSLVNFVMSRKEICTSSPTGDVLS